MKYAFISSGLFPFVSGTTNAVNMAQQRDTDAKIKYTPESSIRLAMLMENFVTFEFSTGLKSWHYSLLYILLFVIHIIQLLLTRNVVIQLVAVERALDMLLASSENISPLSAHGRGPNFSLNVVPL